MKQIGSCTKPWCSSEKPLQDVSGRPVSGEPCLWSRPAPPPEPRRQTAAAAAGSQGTASVERGCRPGAVVGLSVPPALSRSSHHTAEMLAAAILSLLAVGAVLSPVSAVSTLYSNGGCRITAAGMEPNVTCQCGQMLHQTVRGNPRGVSVLPSAPGLLTPPRLGGTRYRHSSHRLLF